MIRDAHKARGATRCCLPPRRYARYDALFLYAARMRCEGRCCHTLRVFDVSRAGMRRYAVTLLMLARDVRHDLPEYQFKHRRSAACCAYAFVVVYTAPCC